MKVRNGIGAGQKRAADFAPGGVAMRMKNPRPAVRGFTRESQLCSGAVELGTPFNQLRDVFGAFLDEQRHRFGATKPVSRVDRVLFVQADFVFVAEGYGDATLRVGRCRFT